VTSCLIDVGLDCEAVVQARLNGLDVLTVFIDSAVFDPNACHIDGQTGVNRGDDGALAEDPHSRTIRTGRTGRPFGNREDDWLRLIGPERIERVLET
jgi:hypothetical protein